jgi:hypothetical protein
VPAHFLGSARHPAPLFLRSVALLVLIVRPFPADAADTIEPWQRAATDVETYVGFQGRGQAQQLVYGRGITDRLSAYVSADGSVPRALDSVHAGVFGTVVDTRHVDVDLLLGAGLGGAGWREYEVVPTVEVNVDRTPERDAFGGYLRLSAPVQGPGRATIACVINPGVYLTLSRRRQLLLEWDTTAWLGRADQQRATHGVALGYNVTLSPTIELISEVHLALPSSRGSASAAFRAGVIVTLPRNPSQ